MSITVAGAPPHVLPEELEDEELAPDDPLDELADPPEDELPLPPDEDPALELPDPPLVLEELEAPIPDRPPSPSSATHIEDTQESPVSHVLLGKHAHRSAPVGHCNASFVPLHAAMPINQAAAVALAQPRRSLRPAF